MGDESDGCDDSLDADSPSFGALTTVCRFEGFGGRGEEADDRD